MKKINLGLILIFISFTLVSCDNSNVSEKINTSEKVSSKTQNKTNNKGKNENIDEGQDKEWIAVRKELLLEVETIIKKLKNEGKVYNASPLFRKIQKYKPNNNGKEKAVCGSDDTSNCISLFIGNKNNYLLFIGEIPSYEAGVDHGELFSLQELLSSKKYYDFIKILSPQYKTPEKFKNFILKKILNYKTYDFYIKPDKYGFLDNKDYIVGNYYKVSKKDFDNITYNRLYVSPFDIEHIVYGNYVDFSSSIFSDSKKNNIVFFTYDKKHIKALQLNPFNKSMIDGIDKKLISGKTSNQSNKNNVNIKLIGKKIITKKFVGFSPDISSDGEKIIYSRNSKIDDKGTEKMEVYINNKKIYSITGKKLVFIKARYNDLTKKFSFALSKGNENIIVLNENIDNIINTTDIWDLAKIKNPTDKSNILLDNNMSVKYNSSKNTIDFSNGYTYSLKESSIITVFMGFNKKRNILNVYFMYPNNKYFTIKKLIFKIDK